MHDLPRIAPAVLDNWTIRGGIEKNDIKDFVSEKQWPLLIKCLLSDDEAALRRFSRRLDDQWTKFLLSWDTTRKLRQCEPEFRFGSTGTGRDHPYPTNAFLMAVMFNARKCCQFIEQSAPDLDLADVTEYGFNGYHVLFLGLHVLWPHESEADLKKKMEYMHFFLAEFFTSDQVNRMSHSQNCLAMRPLDWGIFRGQVHVVERLMYLSHTLDSKAEVAGVMEHVQIDLSFSVGTSLKRSLTGLAIMSDLYGETNLANLKTIGIFRRPLLIAPWVDGLFWRNSWLLAVYFIDRLAHCILTLIFFTSEVGDTIVERCNDSEAAASQRLPTGFLITISYSMFAFAWQSIVSGICESRKRKYRQSKGYPTFRNMGIRDAVRWQLPYFTMAVAALAIVCLAINPKGACASLGADHLRSVIGCMTLLYILASILAVLVLSRLIMFMSKFINSFYKSFSMFANFLVCYILLLCIFARLFQASGRFVWPIDAPAVDPSCNASRTDQRRLTFFESFYQSFLLTLNVVNTGTFAPKSDRVDLLVTHFVFILLVPTLFINFVTGLLSSVVSDTMDHDVEALYLMKLNFCEYAQTTYFWLYRLIDRIRGRKQRLVISLCMPLHLDSKSISNLKETL